MEVTLTNNYSQFLSWWQQVITALYAGKELVIKQGEGFDPVFFQCGIAIFTGGKIIGCVAIFDNPQLLYQGHRASAIGKFECVDDEKVSHLLIQSAIRKATESGKEYIIGPIDGSTWDSFRYPVLSKNPLIFTEGIYKLWYAQSLIREGFETIAEYATQLDTKLEIDFKKNKRVREYLSKRNIAFRSINIARYEEELVGIWGFCMESFKHNFLFTPIAEKSFIEKYMKSQPYINPDYVLLAEEEGNVVGLVFCLPDIFNTDSKRILIKTLARHPAKEYAGLGNELTVRIYEQAKHDGITGIYHAFMHIENASKALSEQFSGELWREYKLFGKKIEF